MDHESRMRIGIYFNARRDQGGLYQYALTLVHCLHEYDLQSQFTLFHATLEPFPIIVEKPNWVVEPIPRAVLIPQFAIEGLLFTFARLGIHRPLPILPRASVMRSSAIDGMLYVKPTLHSFLWPYRNVFPIHDLQHLLQPEFPEVSALGERRRREFIYQNAVPRAAGILTDSEVGTEDVVEAYNAKPQSVHAVPYLAPTYLKDAVKQLDIDRVRDSYRLPEQFLFYPASFWPHKNHAGIFYALHYIKEQHDVRIHLVLTGGHKHEYARLVDLASQLGIRSQLHFVGYVPDEDMYPLYAIATALVMPTFFGPTNIPILEAWAMNCPVVTSDVRGIREQIGDAGLLVDPNDPESIAQAILKLHTDPDLREELADRGQERIKHWTPRKFTERLKEVLKVAFQSQHANGSVADPLPPVD
jgi:glycosyltransferase involved in cell wall biosynthesis